MSPKMRSAPSACRPGSSARRRCDRRRCREDGVARADVEVVRVGAVVEALSVLRAADVDEAPGVGDAGRRLEQQRIGNREDRRVGADADRRARRPRSARRADCGGAAARRSGCPGARNRSWTVLRTAARSVHSPQSRFNRSVSGGGSPDTVMRLWFAKTSQRQTRPQPHGPSRLCWTMVVRVIQIARLLIILASRHRSLVFENLALRQQLAVYHRTRPKPTVRTSLSRRTDGAGESAVARLWRWTTTSNSQSPRDDEFETNTRYSCFFAASSASLNRAPLSMFRIA